MDVCKPMTDDPILVAIFFIQYFGILLILLASIRTIINTIEIGHPMYALLLQEAIVLTVCVSLKLLVLLVMSMTNHDNLSVLTGFYIAFDVAALQFHQVTCLSVAGMRYYLLYVANSNHELDMNKVFKISFLAVWIAEIIYMPLCQMPWLIGILHSGWPATSFQEIAQKDTGYLIKLLYMTVFVSNIPDFISILLYIKMYSKSKEHVEPEIELQEVPYGGIWVGENEPELENPAGMQNTASTIKQHQDKMRSILKLLKWNAIFCLIDLASGVVWNRSLCRGRLATITAYTFHNFICYGIPILVLESHFRFFGNIWSLNNGNIIHVIC